MILSDKFEEKYNKLNKKQKLAVDSIEGPVLVIAGPGTGKTTILTLRIAEILRKTDTPANGILAITFTDAGVKAMRHKLYEIIGNRAHEVCIHTFHSFASAMMAEYPEHFIETRDFKQMTEVEQETLIRNILANREFSKLRPMGRPDAYITSIIRAISDSKKDAITPDVVRKFAKDETRSIKSDESNISTRGATKGKLKAEAVDRLDRLEKTLLFAGLYERYENEKRTAKWRDYDDLIIELLVTMQEDKLFLRLLQERFLYILVDEHQDTNDSQNFIISLIAEFFETPNVFIVGDEKQAIYRFQGASVENFMRLQKRWPNIKTITLDENYRSHQKILDASFHMIENNYSEGEYVDLRVKLKSNSNENKRPLDIIMGENTSAIEQYLVDELKKIENDEPESTVAIITRRNRDLERVIRLLESNGVSVSSERSVDIFHHPVGVAFFDLIEYLNDPSRLDALSKTLVAGMWGKSFARSVEIIRALRGGQIGDLDKELPALGDIRGEMLRDGAVSGIIHIAEKSSFVSLLMKDPAYVHVWRGIITLAESLARNSEINNVSELIKMMLDYKQSAETKPVKVSVGAPDFPIKAMTAHGSKGLEFDYVFMPYANEESWIGRTRGSSFVLPEKSSNDHEEKDIRRLFYVAITRAKKHATILYSSEESDGEALTPLRFISELHPNHISLKSLPRVEVSPRENTTSVSTNNNAQNLIVDEAKKVLLETGLSVTALNHYIECPSKFLYESILKLPQAPSISAEKGSAMHEALSKVWTLKNKSLKKVEETIIKSVTEFIDRTFLSPTEKEILKKELSENAPNVAKALNTHFNTRGIVSTERWIETFFNLPHKEEKITVRLHGKLDVIIELNDDVSVFDYKTRQAMSVASIKGETKNGDANYFRQLIFYNMLLRGHGQWKTKNIFTSLIFVSPDEKGRCPVITLPIDESDMKRVQSEIESLIKSVWSREITNQYCADPNCTYCGYRRLF